MRNRQTEDFTAITAMGIPAHVYKSQQVKLRDNKKL